MQITNPSEVIEQTVYDNTKIYELAGNNSGHQHSIAFIELPPQAKSLSHYHPKVEESFYVLSGQATVIINQEKALLKPGDCVSVKPGHTHQVVNHADQTLRLLAICTPPWTPDCSVYSDNSPLF